jgi:AAHS family 4-hydroxybenzoate transporter-like MFS transporter
VRMMTPAPALPAEATFIMSDEQQHDKRFRPQMLFEGPLLLITPLIWIAYIASSFAMVFILNWTPIILEALGYSRAQSAMTATWMTVMGVVAALILMRFTDMKGAIAITVMPALGALFLVLTGTLDVGPTAFLILVATIGFFLAGGHFGMHSISGVFYPSSYRANGAGWATSIAKLGSITGPLVGGWLLTTTLPVKSLYVVLAICPLIFAISIFAVGRLHNDLKRKSVPPKATTGTAMQASAAGTSR